MEHVFFQNEKIAWRLVAGKDGRAQVVLVDMEDPDGEVRFSLRGAIPHMQPEHLDALAAALESLLVRDQSPSDEMDQAA